MIIAKKSHLATLIVITFFVLADLICENVLVLINDKQSHFLASIFLFIFLLIQIVFASIQSGVSDFFGRKRSLIFSFTISLMSLLFAIIYSRINIFFGFFLIFALLLKALWGNTIPIAFAAIADTRSKNYRSSYALASSAYSLAFIILVIAHLFFKQNISYILMSASILVLAMIFCIYFFLDSSDRTTSYSKNFKYTNSSHIIKKFWKIGIHEIALIVNELKRPLTKHALSAYTLWEISMYSIIISQIDLNPGPSQNITLAMMLSYLLGVFLLRIKPCKNAADSTMLTIGYVFSFFSLIPFFLFKNNFASIKILLGLCYSFHAIGNAFLSPTVLSIIVKERSSHDQGKILGLVESSDTLAFLIATVFVMLYSTYQWSVVYLVIFSLISFSISIIHFPIIRKLEKNIYK